MGSILGGKPKASSSTTNKVDVPAWLDSKNQTMAARAETLSSQPYTPYTGQRVAAFSGDTNNAFALNRGNTGKYNNLMDSASSGVQQLIARANGPSATDIQSLMNPYTQNVLDTSMRKASEIGGDQQAQLKRQAALAGGFGGSRFAVQQQKQSNDLSTQMNDIQYQGMSDAYNDAMGQWNTGTNTLGSGINAALQTTQTGQQYDTNDIANLLKTGALQEDKDQAQLDVNYADYDTAQAMPYDQISWLSSILNPQTGAYAGTTSKGNQTSDDGQSKVGKAIGMAASVASLFSDERVKENIEEVGKLDNGLSVYKYNYIGSPKTQIGVMAQDVEKKNPNAVSETQEGIKMVDYDKATGEQGYASGGQVSMPMLLEALRSKGTSAGSPNFTGAPAIKDLSGGGGNPILDMISKGGDMGGLSKALDGGISGISKLFGGSGGKEYDNVIGPTMTKDAGGFYGLGGSQGGASWGSSIGNFFGFADGGYVTNSDGQLVESLFDTNEDLAKQRAQYEADKAKSNQPIPVDKSIPLPDISELLKSGTDMVKSGADYYTSVADERQKAFEPSMEDSFAKYMGKKGLGAATSVGPRGMGWLLNQAAEGGSDVESLYDNLFVKPMSQLDTERAQATESTNTLQGLIQDKMATEGDIQSPTGKPPLDMEASLLKMSGEKGMPQPAINPQTNAPYMIDMDKGARGNVPMNIVPPVMEGQIDGSTDGGEMDIMRLLRDQLMPKEAPKKEEVEGGINMPLLMAGLSMMASKGDIGTSLAEGMAAFVGTQGNAKKALEAEDEKVEGQRQKKIKNILDYLKVQAYMNQVNKKSSGAITPYQQAQLALRERSVRAAEKNADTKAKGGGSLFGFAGEDAQPGLTPQDGNANLEDILAAFAEAEAARDTGQQPDLSLLGE